MTESEQARATETQDEKVRRILYLYRGQVSDGHIDAILYAVDSQAQKIAELSALFQKAGNGAVDLAIKCAELELNILEQAKEIERLKDRLRFEMQPEANDGI